MVTIEPTFTGLVVAHVALLMAFASPSGWKSLHFVSHTCRQAARDCAIHPMVPPIAKPSTVMSTVALHGGAYVTIALRTTCRSYLWGVQMVYSYAAWAAAYMNSRVQHLHRQATLLGALRIHYPLLADEYVATFVEARQMRAQLLNDSERAAIRLGFTIAPRRAYERMTVPMYMLN